ncbi:MAG: glycosyltransferase [Weeksellaceae bacterium]
MKKIAIVYDWMDSWGGVERLLLELHRLYPDAAWYTSYVDPKSGSWAEKLALKTSFIQNLPPFIRKSRILSLPFYPYAFESFDFSGFDVVISVTSGFAKGIITRPGTTHISYILSPPRYLWGFTDEYVTGWKKHISSKLFKSLRIWDYIAAQRPDVLLTLSDAVAKRCVTYYQREATVIYPPFDVDYWQNLSPKPVTKLPKDYYLVVSRLEPYKKIVLAIEAINAMPDKHLVIVGKGRLEKNLKSIAGDRVHFYQDLSDAELAYIYTQAKALIMPQEEDFGYVSLEAQTFACPVVAYAQGGAAETVIEGQSGVLFPEQSLSALQAGLARLPSLSYNVGEVRKSVARFSPEHFRKTLLQVIEAIV